MSCSIEIATYNQGWRDGQREMVEARKVCGFTNWETFTVEVELSNNRGLEGLEDARAAARQFRKAREHVFEAAQDLCDWFGEDPRNRADGDSILSAMVEGFLESVNWREILLQLLEAEESDDTETAGDCQTCNGAGCVDAWHTVAGDGMRARVQQLCNSCGGTGRV